jgi:hypothetical protein
MISSFVKTGLSTVTIVCKFFKKILYDINISNYNAENRNEKGEAHGDGNENSAKFMAGWRRQFNGTGGCCCLSDAIRQAGGFDRFGLR